MANQVEIQITADPKNAEAGFKKTQSAFGRMSDSIKKHRKAIGVGLTAVGAGIGVSAGEVLVWTVGFFRVESILRVRA